MERFQSDRTSIVNEDCSGYLTTSQVTDNVEQVNALVKEDSWITVTDGADKMGISCGSAQRYVSWMSICRQ